MINVHDLCKSYDDTPALQKLSMHVPKGAVYGLAGPNGAGKSTLLRCLAGVSLPDSGQIRIDGETLPDNTRLKARIACIPDELYYFTSASARDMKNFLRGFYPSFDEELYTQLGAIFQIDPKKPLRHLSKGMRKQAAFWFYLAAQPDLLLLDEPVDGIDPAMRRQLWSVLLREVERRQLTVVISSHNLRELEDVCDHVGIIDRGQILLERALSRLQEDFVKLQIVFSPDRPPVLPELKPLHHSCTGRVNTFILACGQEEAQRCAEQVQPIFYDILPLTLEEIFIYELGGADNALKDLVL